MATSLAANTNFTEVLSLPVALEPTLQMKLQMPQPAKGNVTGTKNLRNRLRLDPSRALEPARKKISTIEAQRVMSVFEDTIQKAEIVALLPYLMQNLDRFRIVLGGDLADVIEQHKIVHDSYNEIKQALDKQVKRRTVKGSPGGSREGSGKGSRAESGASSRRPHSRQDDLDDAEGNQVIEDDVQSVGSQSEGRKSRLSSQSSVKSSFSIDTQLERTVRNLTLVAQQLSTSCKNVLRGFRTNPAAFNLIKTEYSKTSPSCRELVLFMNELKDILLNKLLTTPEEEKERNEYLQEISLREKNNREIIEKLEAQLKAAQDDKDEEIKKKNDVIRKLKAELHQIEKFAEDHNRRVQSEAAKQEEADIKNSEGRKQRLQQELVQLKTQQQNLIVEHRENEQELRKTKFRYETEVENWIQQYDQGMGERQDEYEEIDAVYTEEKKQLHELEERFKTLEAEYQQIMEERRLARERRDAAEREMALMIKAATTIQAFWRSFKVRKALKARKKKGGKKGKK
ncbi:hypothetical protein ACJMK2_013071 [Sinanodonta woodiana]|uniref:Dynein regulatory complex protein 10 n=1 Tax=Sinanodonta woodiana TaxID=1069815 RepID=A0ABD3VA74_SINWO